MGKKYLYIAISIIISLLVVGLIGWAIFVNKQQQALQTETQDLGYFGSTSGTSARGNGFLGSFFSNGSEDTATAGETTTPSKSVLRQLYNLPTSGFVKTNKDTIRFVDRTTGYVFEKKLSDGTTTRLDQTTVPQVYSAFFFDNGKSLVRQYTDQDERVVSILGPSSGGPTTALAPNMLGVAVKPNQKSLALLERSTTGSDVFIYSPEEGTKKLLFHSLLRGWGIQWTGGNVLLTQKASSDLPGTAYVINSDTGSATLILQQIAGLETNASPDGTKILFSSITKDIPTLSLLDTASGGIKKLPLSGLAEKCAWHPTKPLVYCALPDDFPKETYPDAWYQGSVHFTDSLYVINTESGTSSLLRSPNTTDGLSLDIIKVVFDSESETLLFINKFDQTLWSLTLPQDESATTTSQE